MTASRVEVFRTRPPRLAESGGAIHARSTASAAPGLWIGFTLFVLALLALDLGVFHRKAHAVGYKEALGWCAFWIGLALGFNLLVYHWFGPGARARVPRPAT